MTTPSTISTFAWPRTESARAWPGVFPPSMDRATSGRADSAATFGEVVAVEAERYYAAGALGALVDQLRQAARAGRESPAR